MTTHAAPPGSVQTVHHTHIDNAVDAALRTIDGNRKPFATLFPNATTVNNVYPPFRPVRGFAEGANQDWTSGFWTGELWIAYEITGEERFRSTAEAQLPSYFERVDIPTDVDTHDLGFVYSLGCVPAWRLTGNSAARDAALLAADYLTRRYLSRVGIIQAWGDLDDPTQRGRTIVDSLMNTPLLYWASHITGDSRFAEIAHTHTASVRDFLVRDDATTFHTFYWNPETGEPLYGQTAQGYSDDSCWARGQAWAMYGFALNYRHSRDESFLETALRTSDYFIAHLPADSVAYWDLLFTDGSGEERDSSAAAIAICALDELCRWLPDGERKARYRQASLAMLMSLIDNYAGSNAPESNALLLHGVYGKPQGSGVDEANLWGDYFYLEALMRHHDPAWKPYWYEV